MFAVRFVKRILVTSSNGSTINTLISNKLQLLKVMAMGLNTGYLEDFKPGPLDTYRKQASFDWKAMMVLLDGEEVVKRKFKFWKLCENDEAFQKRHFDSLDEERKVTNDRVQKVYEWNVFPDEDLILQPTLAFAKTVSLFQASPSMAVKYGVAFDMFKNVLLTLGNDSHFDLLEACSKAQICGAFALTEMGHGSNTKAMKTTATFDPKTQEFILNTNSFENAKCWAAGIGKTSTHAIIWAKLILPDRSDMGLHAFVVALRNPESGKPFKGLLVGDMGKKIGLNGVDNGFVMFDNYRVPKSSLLNKTGDVTPDGKYVSPYKSQKQKIGASFGALSGGRIGIIHMSLSYLTQALTIGVRYAAVRKQFGPTDDLEIPIIEYQLLQCRLFPYLASAYALKMLGNALSEVYGGMIIASFTGERNPKLEAIGPEIHALSCTGKPIAGWLARDGIQECREACGGHGYLESSKLGELRNNNDPNCTYEGDNNVLIQQASNWLLQLWNTRHSDSTQQVLQSSLGSVNFMKKGDQLLKKKFTPKDISHMSSITVLIECYEWLLCYLLQSTTDKWNKLLKDGKDEFTAKNQCQMFYAKNLSLAYIHHYMLKAGCNFIQKNTNEFPELTSVLTSLVSLYGVWTLEKFLADFYQGGYFNGYAPAALIKESIINLCDKLKPEAVALVDAIAPTDFILSSSIGNSDGLIYENLKKSMFDDPYTFKVADWWNKLSSLQSKL